MRAMSWDIHALEMANYALSTSTNIVVVGNIQVWVSSILIRNVPNEENRRDNTHTLNALRFWVNMWCRCLTRVVVWPIDTGLSACELPPKLPISYNPSVISGASSGVKEKIKWRTIVNSDIAKKDYLANIVTWD